MKRQLIKKLARAITAGLFLALLLPAGVLAQDDSEAAAADELSLVTESVEDGFEVALTLARKGVTSTQPDKDVLFALRPNYSHDPALLTLASQIAAIHFQTVAAANDYWRDADTDSDELSLITDGPEEGFEVALTLARRGVTSTQSDKDVLFALRPNYSHDPALLMAASQVVSIHFQTVAKANNYWAD